MQQLLRKRPFAEAPPGNSPMLECAYNAKIKHNKENAQMPDELEDLISAINAPLSLDDLSNVQLSTVSRNATSTLRG